jgi:riboflavin kinase/FMN adenylyltransferase
VIVVSSPDEVTLAGGVLCIGNFDGVHLAHQRLLARMRELAQDAPSIILTFFPTSRMVFQHSGYLSSREEKLRLFQPYRPEAVVVVPFSRGYAKTDKSVFLAQLERLAPQTIIVGEDFRFGHNRAGGLDDLQHVAGGLEVFGIQELDGEVISSSRIRALLQEGELEAANRFLGYDYFASGSVISGARRGRALDYPTANLQVAPGKVLPMGVFGVTADTPSGKYGGMASTGVRPNFPEDSPSIEVNLFDFNADLYGQEVTVSFHHFLREQQKFEGLEGLKAQLAEDERRAKELLP